MRRFGLALAFGLALLLLDYSEPAPARAAITFGSDLTLAPSATPGSCQPTAGVPCTDVAISFHPGNALPVTAPISGVITAVRYRSTSADTATLRLARREPLTGDATGAGTGPTATLVPSGNVESVPTQLRVQAGDYLATDGSTTTAFNCNASGASWDIYQPTLIDGAAFRSPATTIPCELLIQG